MKTWRNIVITLTVLVGLSIISIPVLHAFAPAMYVSILNDSGAIINGATAGASVFAPHEYVSALDSTGHVINTFGGGGATTCGGLSDSGTLCTANAVTPPALGATTPAAGTFTNINAGTCGGTGTYPSCASVTNGGTISCNMSGVSICKIATTSGTITWALPTNMVADQQYYLVVSSGGVTAINSSTTMKFNDPRTNTVFQAPNFNSGLSGTIQTIPFKYDGSTNIYVGWNGEIGWFNTVYAATVNSSAVNAANVTSTGPVSGTTGTFTGLLNTQAVAVASLPATCVKNAIITVTDATSLTAGVCVGSGSTSVLAICSATNTWSCL